MSSSAPMPRPAGTRIERVSETGADPFVSVAVRSYARLPALIELAQMLLAQDYPHFEVVVIEQSPEQREHHRAELAAVTSDPRVRLLEYPPLGAGRARIEAARQSRGEIIVFMDDDDVPLRRDWLSAMVRNFRDPLCVAVSGRQVFSGTENEDPQRHDTARNRRWCLRYSFLRMPNARVRHNTRIQGVTQVAGGNAAIRASAIERAGGWDAEDDHDEDSFNFRFQRVRRPGEYFAYDPEPAILRRFDIPGGLKRRAQSVAERVRAELLYSHRIVRKYYPGRFHLFYPCYLWLAGWRAIRHVHQSQPTRLWLGLVLELLRTGPVVYLEVLLASSIP